MMNKEYVEMIQRTEEHNKTFMQLRKEVIDTITSREILRSIKGHIKAKQLINTFIGVYSNTKLKVYDNFSIKDFNILLRGCSNWNEFSCSMSKIEEVVRDEKYKTVNIYTPESIAQEEEYLELFGDDEDKEFWQEQTSKMKTLYNEIKYCVVY